MFSGRIRRHRFGVLQALGAVGAALLVVVAGAGPAASQPIYPAPDPDPFYAAPRDVAKAKPGQVLGMRPLPPLPLFPGVTITLVKFRSTNSEGHPIAATTTVMTPAGFRPGAPLLSYQHIINGLGAPCAVSRVLYTSDPNLTVREAPALNVALARGWTVALPDHLGPTFAYGAARLGGQITLDGIRAVKQVQRFGLRDSRTVMAGYSGGGMATSWAAALAPTYAPELKISGAAYGGVPMNMVKMLEQLGFHQHPVFGLVMAAALGLEREYPDRLPITEQLNSRGLAARKAIANGCTNDLLLAGAGHGALDFAKSTSLINSRSARSVVEENSLELFNGVPTIPVYEWHSPGDLLIPIDSVDKTIRRYCRSGVRLQIDRVFTQDHLTAAVLGLPGAMNWIEGRFRGEPAPRNC